MEFALTLALAAILFGVAGLCGWIGSRPANPLRPRLLPYRVLMMLTAAAAIVVTTHLVNLLGVNTGPGAH